MRITVDPSPKASAGSVPNLFEAIKIAASATPGVSKIDVMVSPGVYELRQPLKIGRLAAPLRIHASGEGARLIGGAMYRVAPVPLESGDPVLPRIPLAARGNVRWIDLHGAKAELAGPVRHGMNLPPGAGSELFMNGHPLTVARWPDDGWASIESVVDHGSASDRPNEPLRGGTFRVADRSRLAAWAAAGGVWLAGYWHRDWADDEMPAGKIDEAAGTITLGMPHTYGLEMTARYRVTNIPEELDAPGEYWIDPVGARAYLIPPGDGAAGGAEFIVSLLGEPLLTIEDTTNIEIDGLTFEAGRSLALRATHAEGVRVHDCTFRNTGTGAVEVDGRHCEIIGCRFEDIGAGGVSLTGGDRATLTHADNAVRDCVFERCGRTHPTYQPAIRLDGVGQTVANNRIDDLPHSAIIFAGNEHVIELNEISRVLLETGDCGAIYCGRDWTLHGTVIRHNFFHDLLGTDARYQNAVYLDDMASGITVEGNIFLRCHWGMLVGGGRDIRVRGNVFASCSKGLSFDNRGVGWMAKAIADPEKSTLHQRLRAVPIDKEPWHTRYPTLGRVPHRPVRASREWRCRWECVLRDAAGPRGRSGVRQSLRQC